MFVSEHNAIGRVLVSRAAGGGRRAHSNRLRTNGIESGRDALTVPL